MTDEDKGAMSVESIEDLLFLDYDSLDFATKGVACKDRRKSDEEGPVKPMNTHTY